MSSVQKHFNCYQCDGNGKISSNFFSKLGMTHFLTDLNYPTIKIFSASPAELLQKYSPVFRLHLLQSSKKDEGISCGDTIVLGCSYFSVIAFRSGHRMLNSSSCMMIMDFCRSKVLYPMLLKCQVPRMSPCADCEPRYKQSGSSKNRC